jgi:sortase (surface protein transpeptidase)
MLKIILILPVIFTTGWLVRSMPDRRPEPEPVANWTKAEPLPEQMIQGAGEPVRLLIPAIAVNAEIVAVGLTPDKIVDTPRDEVGFWGDEPGLTGTATLNGHFINDRREPGIFNRLGELRPGDDILVTDRLGQVHAYRVWEKELVAVEEFPLKKVYRRTDEGRLQLITCAGRYEPARDDYSKRTIVYARLMEGL